MVFDVQVTDLYGTVLATVVQYTGVEALLPISDERTGKSVISHYDPAAAELIFVGHNGHVVAALGRMIRIKYRGHTLLWAPITQPKFGTNQAQVTLGLVGPTFKLRHRQLNYSDPIVSPEDGPAEHAPADWRTMQDIVEAAYDTTAQAAINVPDIGVHVVNVSGVEAPSAFWTEVQRGSNNWDKLEEVGKGPYGGEFDVVPYDPAGGETPFDAGPTSVGVGAFTFPNSPRGAGQTAATVPLDSGGLALPAAGKVRADIIDGSSIHRRYTLTYTGRTATTLTGVKGYPPTGEFDGTESVETFGGAKPYHYADLKVYDLLGTNRTGLDLAEDPDNPGTFFDPDTGAQPLTLLYDDQDPDGSTCAEFNWEPDGDNCRNQQVSLVSANDETKRGIRKIARNTNSWLEVGVLSGWDSVGGANTIDVSEDNLAGVASNEVEKYGRPPNFFKAVLHLESAAGSPTFGNPGWRPQLFRDFYLGDRVLARMRQGYVDSGTFVARIMSVKVSQADANNNVRVELECVPHVTDASEITVS